jgi:hypothetical protein
MDYDITMKVLAALVREQVRYVVFGAVALNLLGLPRATEDLDIFIEPRRENVERLKAALRSVFEDPCIEEITADTLDQLYRMKKDTVRPKDRGDAARIAELLHLDEES